MARREVGLEEMATAVESGVSGEKITIRLVCKENKTFTCQGCYFRTKDCEAWMAEKGFTTCMAQYRHDHKHVMFKRLR